MRYGWLLAPFYLTFSTSGFAATADEDLFSLSLEELLSVKVTSTSFFDETLSTTSYSVTPSTQEQWQGLGVRNLGELMNHMPSTVAPSSTGQSRIMAIRGYLDANPNTGTILRLDGVPMNKIREGGGLMPLDGYDLSLLKSAEQIRGPGSSLHGNDAFHGVLSLNTLKYNKPQAHLNAEAGAFDYSATSVNGYTQQGNHGFTGGIALRNIGDTQQTYYYLDNASAQPTKAQRKNSRKSANVLAKYNYSRNALTLNTTLFYLDLNANQLPGAGEQPFGNQQARDFSEFSNTLAMGKVGGQYSYNANQTLKFLGFYWQDKDAFSIDLTNTNLGIINQSAREESHKGLQLHQLHKFSNNNNLTYGYEYLDATLDGFSYSITAANGQVIVDEPQRPEVGYARTVHSVLIDGRQQLHTSGLALNYGLRYDNYNDFNEQFSPRIGVIAPVARTQTVIVTYGQAFRAPSLYELLGGTQIAPNASLQPETLESLDIKYRIQLEHWMHTVTMFHNTWEDAIRISLYEQPQNGLAGYFDNTGSSSAHGLEYELKGRWQKFQMDLNVSHIQDNIDDDTQEYIMNPCWISDLNTGYTFNQHWSAHSNNRYMYRNAVENKAPSLQYFRSDLIVQWVNQTKNLRLNFALRNIFNKHNTLPYNASRPGGLTDDVRNFSTGIRYTF